MHPARPTLPARRCPACGAAVDPLRAGAVVALEDGLRYLCGEPCRVRFTEGERPHDRFSTPPTSAPTLSQRVRDATSAQAPVPGGRLATTLISWLQRNCWRRLRSDFP